jgi:hypothetical protein
LVHTASHGWLGRTAQDVHTATHVLRHEVGKRPDCSPSVQTKQTPSIPGPESMPCAVSSRYFAGSVIDCSWIVPGVLLWTLNCDDGPARVSHMPGRSTVTLTIASQGVHTRVCPDAEILPRQH